MVANECVAVMNDCKITRGGYESPSVKLLFFQPEGVLCSSGMTEQFENGEFDWN
jgi:hypothetical protein